MIITLCGSLRFEEQFHLWNEKLSFAGHVVYDCSIHPSWKKGQKDWYTPYQKLILDMLHLAKIEESDAIVVLNVGGYVGESTAREITWARIRRKGIFYLETKDINRLAITLIAESFA